MSNKKVETGLLAGLAVPEKTMSVFSLCRKSKLSNPAKQELIVESVDKSTDKRYPPDRICINLSSE